MSRQHLRQPQPLPAAVIAPTRCTSSSLRAKQLQPRLSRHVGLRMRQLTSLVLRQLLLRLRLGALPCMLLLVGRLLVFPAFAAACGACAIRVLLVCLPALLLVGQLGVIWFVLCVTKLNNTLGRLLRQQLTPAGTTQHSPVQLLFVEWFVTINSRRPATRVPHCCSLCCAVESRRGVGYVGLYKEQQLITWLGWGAGARARLQGCLSDPLLKNLLWLHCTASNPRGHNGNATHA